MSTPLGIKIRRARDQRGWSRRKLATEADIPYTTLSNIEEPKRKKPVRTSEINLQKLATALELDLDELRILAGYLNNHSASLSEAKLRMAAEMTAHPQLEKALAKILRRNDKNDIDQAVEYLNYLDSRHTQ